jgi:hypothetical protein
VGRFNAEFVWYFNSEAFFSCISCISPKREGGCELCVDEGVEDFVETF